MHSKALVTALLVLSLASHLRAEELLATSEKLAEIACAVGSEEYRLTFTEHVFRMPEESTFSDRLVVFTVDRQATRESGELQPIWRDVTTYLSGVFPRPAWSVGLVCGPKPGWAWLIVAASSAGDAWVGAYALDIAGSTERAFPDPKTYVGKPVGEDKRPQPQASWVGRLPGDFCGIQDVEVAVVGMDVLVRLTRQAEYCSSLRMLLDTKANKFGPLERVEDPSETLAEVVCPPGSEEFRLSFTKQVFGEPFGSSSSDRLVVLSVNRRSSRDPGEPRVIWRDISTLIWPVRYADLVCGRKPGQAWLIVTESSGSSLQVSAYDLENAATTQRTFPDPKALLGKPVEDMRAQPQARWVGDLPEVACRIQGVEVSLLGDDLVVLMQFHRPDAYCHPARMRLETNASKFGPIEPVEKK